jgi:hypothetical protein
VVRREFGYTLREPPAEALERLKREAGPWLDVSCAFLDERVRVMSTRPSAGGPERMDLRLRVRLPGRRVVEVDSPLDAERFGALWDVAASSMEAVRFEAAEGAVLWRVSVLLSGGRPAGAVASALAPEDAEAPGDPPPAFAACGLSRADPEAGGELLDA